MKKISVLSCLVASLVALTSGQAREIPAKILNVDGSATVNIPGEGTRPLVIGELIPVGSEINTSGDGVVTVGLTPGAGVVVEENTQLSIDALSVEKKGEKLTKREVALNLKNDEGSAISFLKDFDGVTDYKVKTASGVAAARGTVWKTTSTSVQVVNGNVEVTIGGVTVSVPAGNAMNMEGGGVTGLTTEQLQAIGAKLQAAGVPVTPSTPSAPGEPREVTVGDEIITLDVVSQEQ